MCSFPHKEMHVCTHTHVLLYIKCTKLNFRICLHRHICVCAHIYMYIFMCVYIDVTYWTQKISKTSLKFHSAPQDPVLQASVWICCLLGYLSCVTELFDRGS